MPGQHCSSTTLKGSWAGLEPELIEKCYKFADRTTGRILLLRPDVTAQIARIVAMGMVGPSVPLRLCYRTTVFRHEPEHAGREREIFQVGAELIGVDDVAADGEILALMIECLKQLGLQSFKIALGHVGFFKALLARSGMSPDGQKRAELLAQMQAMTAKVKEEKRHFSQEENQDFDALDRHERVRRRDKWPGEPHDPRADQSRQPSERCQAVPARNHGRWRTRKFLYH